MIRSPSIKRACTVTMGKSVTLTTTTYVVSVAREGSEGDGKFAINRTGTVKQGLVQLTLMRAAQQSMPPSASQVFSLVDHSAVTTCSATLQVGFRLLKV